MSTSSTADTTPSKTAKHEPHYQLIGVVLIVLLAAGVWLYSAVRKQDPQITAGFEKMSYLENMRFVKQIYREIIPVSEGTQLKFLLETTGHIYGVMDMSRVDYDIDAVSRQVRVTLPEPFVEEPVIRMDSVREYKFQGRPVSFLLSGGGRKFMEIYKDFAVAIGDAKKGIKENAVKTGILDAVEKQARIYILSIGSGFGYQIKFISAPRPEMVSGSQESQGAPSADGKVEGEKDNLIKKARKNILKSLVK